MVSRGERRVASRKVAQRRFEDFEGQFHLKSPTPVALFGKEAGFYRKMNPFTFPKVPKRGWQKKVNAKHVRVKDERRNGSGDED